MGLPLRMNNLHAPTVPSGPASTTTEINGHAGRQDLAQLQQNKINLEAELRALGGVLDSHGVNMNTPLLTGDGFPRADVDVAQIRTTRARIIRLRNDHKALMEAIEKFLHDHFAGHASANDTDSRPQMPHALSDAHPNALDVTFAKVDTVAPDSPAERAGLKAGDEIRAFGHVNRSNHDSLKRVVDCVQDNEGRSVFIRVSRPTGAAQRQELRLTLTPTRNWGGRGMLGCHIVPL